MTHGPIVITGRRRDTSTEVASVVVELEGGQRTRNVYDKHDSAEPWWAYVRQHVLPLEGEIGEVLERKREEDETAQERALAAARMQLDA